MAFLGLVLALFSIIEWRFIFILEFVIAFFKTLLVIAVAALVGLGKGSTAAARVFWEEVINQQGLLLDYNLTLSGGLCTTGLL